MREIKFRAIFDGKIVEYFKWQDCNLMYSENNLHWHFGRKYAHSEIQQFTGLKDKTSKDIYEGDVGQSVDDVLWEVKYDTELARFIGLYDGNIIEDLSEVHDSMEIIGNIYENPDLLPKA